MMMMMMMMMTTMEIMMMMKDDNWAHDECVHEYMHVCIALNEYSHLFMFIKHQ